ncbi:hypothetical protein GJ629_07475 [Halapricum sp. CBA1109]|nr:hypothetical protein [Halapricum sp. CBA1109]
MVVLLVVASAVPLARPSPRRTAAVVTRRHQPRTTGRRHPTTGPERRRPDRRTRR